MLRFYFKIITIVLLCYSCADVPNAIDTPELVDIKDYNQEIADSVKIIYSDSAIVRAVIYAPKMIRYKNGESYLDEFSEGLHVEFKAPSGRTTSWLDADYGLKDESESKVYLRDDIEFRNAKNDLLYTDELIWEEKSGILSTEKPVKIIQLTKGDTLFGFGMVTDKDFNSFEIKRSYSSRMKMESLTTENSDTSKHQAR